MTTITRAALDEQCELYGLTAEQGRAFAQALGITIAPPEPPEGMVNLAREICAARFSGDASGILAGQWDSGTIMQAALAALQFADKVVQEERAQWNAPNSATEALDNARRELGAIA